MVETAQMEWYDWAFKILELFKWPLVAIIITLIFRESLMSILKRVTTLPIGKGSITIAPITDQESKKTALDFEVAGVDSIQKNLFLYYDETVERFRSVVDEKSGYLDVKDDSEKLKALHNYSTLILSTYHFELIYNLIWGSQIRLLKWANTVTEFTKVGAKNFYTIAVKTDPEAYKDYSFEDYFLFIESHDLIVKVDQNYSLSTYGKDFLKFMIDFGKADNRPF